MKNKKKETTQSCDENEVRLPVGNIFFWQLSPYQPIRLSYYFSDLFLTMLHEIITRKVRYLRNNESYSASTWSKLWK